MITPGLIRLRGASIVPRGQPLPDDGEIDDRRAGVDVGRPGRIIPDWIGEHIAGLVRHGDQPDRGLGCGLHGYRDLGVDPTVELRGDASNGAESDRCGNIVDDDMAALRPVTLGDRLKVTR